MNLVEKLYKNGDFCRICDIVKEEDIIKEWENNRNADNIKRIMTIGIVSALKCGNALKMLDFILMSQKILGNIKYDILKQLRDLIENYDYEGIEQLEKAIRNEERLSLYVLLAYYYKRFFNDDKTAKYFIKKIKFLPKFIRQIDETAIISLCESLSKDFPEIIDIMKSVGVVCFGEDKSYAQTDLLNIFINRVIKKYDYNKVLSYILYYFHKKENYDLVLHVLKRLNRHGIRSGIKRVVEDIAKKVFEKGLYIEAYGILKEFDLLCESLCTIKIWVEYLWNEYDWDRFVNEIDSMDEYCKSQKERTNKIYFWHFVLKKMLESSSANTNMVINKIIECVNTNDEYYRNINALWETLNLLLNYGAENYREYASLILEKILEILKNVSKESNMIEHYIVWSLKGLDYSLKFGVKTDEFADWIVKISPEICKVIYNFNPFCYATGYLKDFSYYDVYMKITEKSEYNEFKAFSLIYLAELLIKNQKEDEAVELINTSLDIFQSMIAEHKKSPNEMLYKMNDVVDNPFSFFIIFPYNLFDILSSIKDEKVKGLWDKLIDLFNKEGFKMYVVKILLKMGKYKESINVIREMDSDEEKAASFNEVFKYLINYKDKRYIFDIVDNVLLKEMADFHQLSEVLYDVAVLFVDRGDYKSAEEIILRSPQGRYYSLVLWDIMNDIMKNCDKDRECIEKVMNMVPKIDCNCIKHSVFMMLLEKIIGVEDELLLERFISMIDHENNGEKDEYYYGLVLNFLKKGEYNKSKLLFNKISCKYYKSRFKEMLAKKIMSGKLIINEKDWSLVEDAFVESMVEPKKMERFAIYLCSHSVYKSENIKNDLVRLLEKYWINSTF